jgi:small subunit ribosomal protein S17
MPIKERIGRVISTKRQKTITVLVESHVQHPRYHKVMRQRKKLHVHDEGHVAQLGDTVRVIETRPLSKTVHWRLLEVIEHQRGLPSAGAAEGKAAEASR